MKKLIALILAALLVAALFAGCSVSSPIGGTTEGKTSEEPTSTEKTSAEPTAAAQPDTEPIFEEYAPLNPGTPTAESLFGTWVWEYEGIGEIMRFSFATDGAGSMEAFGESQEFSYEVSGNMLDITIDGETESCPFFIIGDTLTLTIEGEQIELVRYIGSTTSAGRPSGSDGGSLIGTWVWEYEGLGELMTFVFNADGTGYIDSLGEVTDFTYTVSGDTIYMTHEGDTESVPFSLVGDTLILDIDGEEVELIRK